MARRKQWDMITVYPDAIVMECPRCGRLWVESFMCDFTQGDRESMRGPHAPALFHGKTYLGHNAGYATCLGVPEHVHRGDVQAAWILGGKEAAQACVNKSLAYAIEAYEAYELSNHTGR